MKTKLSRVLTFLILFSYLKPFNATLVDPINRIYGLLKIAATLLLLVCVFQERIVLSKSAVACLALVGVWTVSVLLNNGGFGGRVQQIMSICGIVLLVAYLKPIDGGLDYMFRLLHHFSAVYIVLQFVTVLKNGPLIGQPIVSYDKYFLGGDNYSAFILICLAGFLLSYELARYQCIRLGAWVVAWMGFASLLIPFAVAGMVAYLAFLMLVVFRCYPAVRKLASVRNALLLSCILLTFVVCSYTGEHMNVTILGKVGLNSREIIWPKAFGAFLQRPLIGYGSLTQAQVDSYILYGGEHAHNIVMEFIFSTGIVGVCLAGYWLRCSLKNVRKVQSRAVDCLVLCFAAFALCGIFDFYIGMIYFWLLVVFTDAYKDELLQKRKAAVPMVNEGK